jgi:hypothetical protein
MRPTNCYETARGDLAPPHALSPTEAVELFESGVLEARDVPLLSEPARAAVLARIKGFDVTATETTDGRVAIWGLKRGDVRTVVVAEGTH